MRIAFYGSSLLSAYWNGACTYYRGIVRALHARGHEITFFEPDAYDRQAHRDIADPDWATPELWIAELLATEPETMEEARRHAERALDLADEEEEYLSALALKAFHR